MDGNMQLYSINDLTEAYHNFSDASDKSKEQVIDYLLELTGLPADTLMNIINECK